MGGLSSLDDCITHQPWGGLRGKDWVYIPEGFIKNIKIVHAGVIDRIRFQNDCDTTATQTSIFGGKGGNKTDTICVDHPSEYLTSISGTIGQFGGCTVVTSLCFQTNKIRYGPYGTESGSPFSYDGKGGAIVGFHGRACRYIDAIGIYVIPESHLLYRYSPLKDNSIHELCCKMSGVGPWGGGGGNPWDDGVFSSVKQVCVIMGESLKMIYGIQFVYAKRDGNSILSQLHGGRRGVCKTEPVDLDGEKEYLTRISGIYGPIKELNGLEGITSVTFYTNKKNYGPYGEEGGAGSVYFMSTSSPGKIVGFQGRNGDILTAIGVHMEYF